MSIFDDVAYPGWLSKIVSKLKLESGVAAKTLRLFHDGATVPFVVRYRQQDVGGIDSEIAYALYRELESFENVVKLRNSRICKLKNSGKYDDTIGNRFMACYTLEELDEAYISYKESTSTKVQQALAIPGMQTVAVGILAGSLTSIARREDDYHIALGWLLADQITHMDRSAEVIEREGCQREVVLTSAEKTAAKGTPAERCDHAKTPTGIKGDGGSSAGARDSKAKYSDYFTFSKPLRHLTTHQVNLSKHDINCHVCMHYKVMYCYVHCSDSCHTSREGRCLCLARAAYSASRLHGTLDSVSAPGIRSAPVPGQDPSAVSVQHNCRL